MKRNYMHSSHHKIIKYIRFEPIYYTINLVLRHPIKFLANLSRPGSRPDPIDGSEPVSGTRDHILGFFT